MDLTRAQDLSEEDDWENYEKERRRSFYYSYSSSGSENFDNEEFSDFMPVTPSTSTLTPTLTTSLASSNHPSQEELINLLLSNNLP